MYLFFTVNIFVYKNHKRIRAIINRKKSKMYQKKSEIIKKIQSYHHRVAEIYDEILLNTKNSKITELASELKGFELEREKYLNKHREIAVAMNCWLDFPCDKLSNQIEDCLEKFNSLKEVTMADMLQIAMHFDNCLLKLYTILSAENTLSESAANIFYYMLKKTKKDQELISEMVMVH